MIYLVQFANYTLSLFMWLILGRAALGVILGHRENLLTHVFARLTDPLYAITRRVLPFASAKSAPLWSLLLLGLLRVLLIVAFRPATLR